MSDADSGPTLHSQATLFAAAGRHADAIQLLSRAAAKDPDNAEYRCDLALALMHAGYLADADREAYHALQLAPNYERSYRIRSSILRKAGRVSEAVSLAREAVRLDPENPFTLHTLAQALYAARHYGEVWRLAQEVARLAPDRSESHQLLGQAAIGVRKWVIAERASREALRLNPADWAAMNNLGVALQRQRKKLEAAKAYDYAAQLNPAADTPRRNLIRVTNPTRELGMGLLMVLLLPITAPFVGASWLYTSFRARRTRSRLSRGAQMYSSSQTLRASVRRLGTREFGVAVGAFSFLAWVVVLYPVGISITATDNQQLARLLVYVSAAALASATGWLGALLRSRWR